MSETLTLTEAARVLGVRVTFLRSQMRAGKLAASLDSSRYPPRYRVRRADLDGLTAGWRLWSDADDQMLVDLLGHMPLAAIARRLGRTERVVQRRIHHLGVNQRTGASHYTASEASQALGVTREGILEWIRRGELKTLPYRPVWGPTRCRLIAHEEIERFIRARITGPPRKKPCWTWRRIPPGYFRNYASRIAAREEQAA